MAAAARDLGKGLGLRPLTPAHPDPDAEPSRLALRLVGALLLFAVVLVTWSAFATLDVTTRANGTVTAPSRLQEVQSLEGGIVEAVLVREGERVRKGQPLVRLDTAQTSSDLGESRLQEIAAMAARARYDALLNGGEPRIDPAWQREAPDLIEKELQLWREGVRELRSTLGVLREGAVRRRAEIREAEARLVSLRASIQVAEESYAIEERLSREGAGARADLLAARQRLLQQRTELDSLQQSLPRLQAALAEVQAQAVEAEARARAQWSALRSEAEAKAGTLGAGLVAKRDRAARRELVSPMDGVVNRIIIKTRGGVAGPGKPILEVVPEEDEVQLTARVKPTDIGFVHVGQKAHVRVLPYDAATHGQMEAEVRRVGADSVLDERGEPYFEVQLSAARGQLKLHGQALPIQPGMPVDVGILTGERTVMQYLLKPVLRGVQGALQER